jgi:hypothetical protein
MSGSPYHLTAASAAARSAPRSARSAGTAAASTPAAASSATAAASGASRRATTTTLAPARPRASAMARPIPEPPPVTSATRPASEKILSRYVDTQ